MDRPKRWSDSLRELAQNSPTNKGTETVISRLLAMVRKAQGRLGVSSSKTELQEVQEDQTALVVAQLLARYRNNLMSMGVTNKALTQVLDATRAELKKRARHDMRQCEMTEEMMESCSFFSRPIFQASVETDDLELVEELFDADVITMEDYLFLYGAKKGASATYIAELLGWSAPTGINQLEEACTKVRKHLAELDRRIASSAPMPVWTAPKRAARARRRVPVPSASFQVALQRLVEL